MIYIYRKQTCSLMQDTIKQEAHMTVYSSFPLEYHVSFASLSDPTDLSNVYHIPHSWI